VRILYNNYVSSAATLSASNQNPLYAFANLYDTRLSKAFRTLAPMTTETITAEVTAAPVYCVLAGHNVSSSATIYVEADNSSSFGSTAAFSTTMSWAEGSMYAYFASTTRTHWRVRVVGQSTDTDYLEIGHWRLSTFIEMPGMKPDQTIKDETTAMVDISNSGQAYGRAGYDYRNPTITFPYLSNTERDAIRAMWATVHNYVPVYVILWPGSTSEERPLYSIINQAGIEWKRTDDRNYRWTTSLQFREVY
jgi:hypothetical protein